jgi:hypothetical protein
MPRLLAGSQGHGCGVGRTAMLAISVLLALGESARDAQSAVSRAGSTVETAPQSDLISWCASQQ